MRGNRSELVAARKSPRCHVNTPLVRAVSRSRLVCILPECLRPSNDFHFCVTLRLPSGVFTSQSVLFAFFAKHVLNMFMILFVNYALISLVITEINRDFACVRLS